MSDQTLKLVASIRQRIEATRRRISLLDATAGLLLTVGISVSVWLLSVSVEALFWLSPAIRMLLVAFLSLLATGLIVHFVLRPIARLVGWFGQFTEEHVARLIGSSFPEVSDRMINFLQLSQGAHSTSPSELLDRAVNELGAQIQPVPFENVASAARIRRFSKWTLIPVVFVLVFAGTSPDTFGEASKRLFSPSKAFDRPAPFSIVVEPGDAEIIRGDSVAIEARVDGLPGVMDMTIQYEYEGEIRSRTESLESVENGTFRYVFSSLRQSLRYRLISLPVETAWYRISVVARPVVQRIDITLRAPSYTRLPAQVMESNVGDITALEGSRADLRIAASSEDVAEAFVHMRSGTVIPLAIDAGRISGTIDITESTEYQIELRSPDGITNADPITYRITSIEDAAPTISFLFPEPQSEISEEALAPFAIRFSDDFGFRSLRLFYRLAASKFDVPSASFSSLPLKMDNAYLLDQIVEHSWALKAETPLDPVPGDVIEYYVQIMDNNAVSGPNSAVTPTYSLRFPSLSEQYEQLGQTEDQTESALEELLDEARQIRDQFDQLKEELRQNPETDWQDERRLEQLQQRQQELESSVEEISRNVQEIADEMSENNLVSPETVELFQELREVVDEVNSPELMDALRSLEDSLQKMDLNQIQQNLEDFDFNEQMYMQRLDRALDLFKNLRMQQDLEEAKRRAEDIASIEERLQEKTAELQNEQNRTAENPIDEARNDVAQDEESANESADGEQSAEPDAGQLAAQQEEAARDMEALEKKLEEILERMGEMDSAPTDQMQDLEEDTKDRMVPQQMEKAAEQIRNQQFQEAQKSEQEIQNQMNQLGSQLDQLQQGMQGQQLQMNLAGLRASLADVLTLSEQQEALRLEVVSMQTEGPLLRTAAQEQVVLSEGLTTVADSLQQLARKVPQMSRDVQQQSGEALREMESAIDALTERSSRNAAGNQKGAMTHLNELALILADLLDQMMNSQASSGSGMSMDQLMEQLQNMGKQQESLNEQIQQMLNDAQGTRLTSDLVERMRQLGSQQDQIRQELKRMSRDRSTRNKLLGDLDNLADQMQESVQELLQNRASRQLMQRQQQILTRLLEASKSLQERGQERKRESRTGTPIDRLSPSELTSEERVEQLRRELFNALENGYAPDYEQLIRRYFELLQRSADDAGDTIR